MPNIIQAQPIIPQMASIVTPNGQLQQVQITSTSVAAPVQQQQTTPTSVAQSVTVQADNSQPLTFTGANGQQFTVIPAVNAHQVRGTNLGNLIHVPNIQAIPTVQNIPGELLLKNELSHLNCGKSARNVDSDVTCHDISKVHLVAILCAVG